MVVTFKRAYSRLEDAPTLKDVSADDGALTVTTAFDVVDESASQQEIQLAFDKQVLGKLLGVYQALLTEVVPAPEQIDVEHQTPDGERASWRVTASQIRRWECGELSLQELLAELDETLEVESRG